MAELQQREAHERRQARALRLQLDAVGVKLQRAEASRAVSERALRDTAGRERRLREDLERHQELAEVREARLAQAEEELKALRAERRVLGNRSERLQRQLDKVHASRAYRLVRLTWRIRAGLSKPFRRKRPSGSH
jgi:hypothetical protein